MAEQTKTRTERRFTGASYSKIRIEERDGKPALIRGTAAVFYDGTERTEFELFPGLVERIMPGAFDKVLAAKDTDARALFNHDPNQLLGRQSAGTLKLRSTATGLRYDVEPGDTQVGRDVTEHLRRGDVTGSSFAFTVQSETFLREEDRGVEVRQINEVGELFDVGPVTYPAYEATEAGVRSVEGVDHAAQRWRAWRRERVAERNNERVAALGIGRK